jgi:pimeloyl-ACP methyl ester carboxylesterase
MAGIVGPSTSSRRCAADPGQIASAVASAGRGCYTSPVQPTSRIVVANGLRHRVLEWDGGGRTTVLCLHGFLDLGWAFHRVAPALAAAGHHVVAPDLRGHGATERVGAGGYYYFTDYVFDVADLVEAVARDRLAVAGHSMGGAIACHFAAAFPERAWRIAALEGIRMPETPAEALPERIADWVAGVRRARSRRPRVWSDLEAAAQRVRQMDPLCPEDEARFLAAHGTREVEGGGVSFLHDPLHVTRGPNPFRLELATALWSAIRCPVLLVDGSESERVPIDYPRRLAAFRDGRLATIAGAGHMMMRHRPREVAALLVDFFGG